jgi:RNA polymerase sigma-70 factor (ECF subfamily)
MSDFESFYRGNVQLVYAMAFARLRDQWQAEDIVQETFLRAWQHFEALSVAEPPAQRAWLLQTMRNLATDVWRRQAAFPSHALPVRLPTSGSGADLRMDVMSALAQLGERDREMVVMRYLQDMTSREIGEALGIPEGSVRRRLSECRQVLSRSLGQWASTGAAVAPQQSAAEGSGAGGQKRRGSVL